MQLLQQKLEGDHERCGFILKSGEIVEVQNRSDDPANSYKVSLEDIEKYEDEAAATWHTHPGGTKNLSVSDFYTFLGWPLWEHYIIAPNGVQKYYVEDGELLVDA